LDLLPPSMQVSEIVTGHHTLSDSQRGILIEVAKFPSLAVSGMEEAH